MSINLFYHVLLVDHWEEIFLDQFRKLTTGGLYEQAEGICVSAIGSPGALRRLQAHLAYYPRASLVFRGENPAQYEFPCLSLLHEFCFHHESRVLYLHAKGVTRPGSRPVQDWREYLDHFNIERWRDCLATLECADVCGVNWTLNPQPHFSGNFWWANSEYIRRLPPVQTLRTQDRHQAEFYVGLARPIAASLFDSGVNHYLQAFPPERYRDLPSPGGGVYR